jgi:hypothetical protein
MAISKVNFNSLNVTPTASKTLKFNSSNDGLEAGDVGGALVLISEQTASSSSTISFTSGIDSTYKEYIFKLIDIHHSGDGAQTLFQANASGGSGFNETMTTTFFEAYHSEDDSATGLGYVANNDQAQGTSGQMLFPDVSNDNDSGSSGTLHLFNPSSTTFVKHFIFRGAMHHRSHYAFDLYVAGYFNTTSAIDEIQFKPNTGTIDSGTIKMYGVT